MARSASARQRARRYAKKSGVYATNAGDVAGGTGTSRNGVLAAAQVFAAQAQKNAARFSVRIPAATYVQAVEEQSALVITDGTAAPNAAPFEFGERHPLYGNRKFWYKQPLRAYMSNAARNAGAQNRATEAYGDAEAKQLAEEYGYDQ